MKNFYTSNDINPTGWLRRQLEIQAESLNGNLDKIWPDIRDSAWIGGNCEGWERVPYWLDGFIPLAYLLKNEDMIARAKVYIEKIINSQKHDGWICPCVDDKRNEYDTWALQLISKVLVVYYECSKDERIPDILYKALKNYYKLLKNGSIKLFNWGKFRWFETMIAINFLYKHTGESWLVELTKILNEQGINYNLLIQYWKRPLNKWTFETHIVNIAMMLKSEAVSADLLGEAYSDNAEYLYNELYQHNGTVTGIFTGDECLSGLSAIQGTELCAVVEQMYSYEWLYAYSGDEKWAERLELLAFNALPATVSDDMWTHQYLQMTNQISCENFPGKPIFRTNGSEAHIFGLEPNFGCCTANFGQGFPKLALSIFMYNDNVVENVILLPSELHTEKQYIKLETEYPFKNKFKYTIEAYDNFIFKIRIPSFAKNLMVNGKSVDSFKLSFEFKKGDSAEIEISFEAKPVLMKRPYDLYTLKVGSLIFSLPISYEKKILEYERNGVKREYPYCDYNYLPKSPWQFGFADTNFEIENREVSDTPFSSTSPAVIVKAKVKPIDWEMEDGYETVCAKIPKSTQGIGESQIIEFYPYGSAKLRMTEIPIVK